MFSFHASHFFTASAAVAFSGILSILSRVLPYFGAFFLWPSLRRGGCLFLLLPCPRYDYDSRGNGPGRWRLDLAILRRNVRESPGAFLRVRSEPAIARNTLVYNARRLQGAQASNHFAAPSLLAPQASHFYSVISVRAFCCCCCSL